MDALMRPIYKTFIWLSNFALVWIQAATVLFGTMATQEK
jgi:hypothetical protein